MKNNKLFDLLLKLRISGKDRQDFYSALASTSKEGLAPTDVLEKLKVNFKKNKHPLFHVVNKVLLSVRGGSEGTKAIKRTPGTELSLFFPNDETLLIISGEESGKTDSGYANAAMLIENKRKMRSIVFSAIAKPVAYLMAFIGLMIFFSIKIIPSFEKARPRDMWPPDAAALGWMSDHIVPVSIGVFLFMVLFFIIISILSEKWTGDLRDFFDRKIPPFTIIGEIKATSLMSALSGFLGAGVSFSDAIQKIGQSNSPYMRFQCKRMTLKSRAGKRAEEILIDLPIINKKYHWIIDVYSMVSNSSDAYQLIAKEIMNQSLNKIKIVGDLISNFMLVMLAVFIMWVYFGMMSIASSGT